jgi:hypothetical protein
LGTPDQVSNHVYSISLQSGPTPTKLIESEAVLSRLTTMATPIENVPEVVSEVPKPGTRHPVADPPWAHRMPSSPRSPIFRLALPMLYAAMGISLGTLAGVAAAFATMPAGAESASNVSASTSTIGAQTAARTTIRQNVTTSSETEAVIPAVPNPSISSSDTVDSTTNRASLGDSSTKQSATEHQAAAAQFAPSPAPPIESNPASQLALVETTRAKPSIHPADSAADTGLASAADARPESLDQQLDSVDDTKSSSFYSEGDLTVADYDADAGTIETSDGRTFVIGTTVSVNSASSWQDYRSNVHYKCGQNGSCTLSRQGAVAPNAKLIDRNRSENPSLSQGF